MSSQTTISKGFKQLVAEANAQIKTIDAKQAINQLGSDDVVFVDIRDLPELERDGKIPEAIHVSRGMLEFVVDPESPYHQDIFGSGKQILLYCASGGRSALAAQRLQEMGLSDVSHVGGGLKAWKEADGSVIALDTE